MGQGSEREQHQGRSVISLLLVSSLLNVINGSENDKSILD